MFDIFINSTKVHTAQNIQEVEEFLSKEFSCFAPVIQIGGRMQINIPDSEGNEAEYDIHVLRAKH